ncbi:MULTISPECIES: EF-P 5-aminopentanol modification-associated protein YfmF [Enterococcus]|uniref:EF-P 5-aminopentanol modification-associated protein YfmF n=1 Tax=Enterococcus TaxID=1350 RepID=UPI0002A1C701|nr:MULTISPECIES: insulinase family protein [Enterococcus]EGP4764286.1 insulinase family protein [Enterococcus faecium]EGP5091482.1 insulinase family protein [Enterococcus faecium]EGP5131335.1 insulinase family protein [Enterococcus faecium]EGP5413404.1 insulinase family protein [Enterococcus faecium]EGP5649023.1 insulinase family protein [Enterococcus faecium]
MVYQLAEGVNLHVLPTKQYKTIRIFIRFTARLQQEVITKRSLLSSMLETNSLNYPDQTKLSAKLAELYGASFGLSVRKKGNLHWLNVGISFVNGEYVNDPNLFSQAVGFLKEVLFYPNIKNQQFDQLTFDLEKNNLRLYLESLKEDKQTFASYALQELYFENSPEQKIPSLGVVEEIDKITARSLAAYYQEMMANDQIDIFVVGDVDPDKAAEAVGQLPFEPRETAHPELFYTQPQVNIVKERQVREPIVQAKLNLAYQTNVYYDEPERFALMVFNGLFGGFPHSKLFMNVREKESLAYYASSSVDTFRGFMSVQTGIDEKNRNQVLRLIHEQLESLRNGEITDLELAQTKAMLRNQYLLSLDSPQAAIEASFLDSWLPETKLSDEEWLKRMESVTIKEIQQVAEQIELQAIFFLAGGNANE